MPSQVRDADWYLGAVLALFRNEPAAIIRRAAARTLGAAPPDLVRDVVRESSNIPEIVYLVEAAQGQNDLLAGELRRGTPAGLLTRIYDGPPDPAWLLTVVAEIADPELSDELAERLRDWYRNERDVTPHSVPERFLRRAAGLVSPFDEGGLGTFDELALIPDIDDVYLFFEQLIFYREQRPLAET